MAQEKITAYQRLLWALSVTTQIEAAKILEIPQSWLSDCKRNGEITISPVLEIASQKGISTEWLLNGPSFAANLLATPMHKYFSASNSEFEFDEESIDSQLYFKEEIVCQRPCGQFFMQASNFLVQ